MPSSCAGHFSGSPGAGGLKETPGAPSHNMVRSAVEEHGQAGINVAASSAGSSAIGTEAQWDEEEEEAYCLESLIKIDNLLRLAILLHIYIFCNTVWICVLAIVTKSG